jgi:transcriptional regulator with XRE-family HTH domain
MLGEKLREQRASKGLLQRQIAAELGVDSAYISKMESNEKPVSRQHLNKLSVLLDIPEEELLTLWLANKLFHLAKDEAVGIKAMNAAVKEMKLIRLNAK